MDMQSISDIRKEYVLQSLDETDLAADPFIQFEKWWSAANESKLDEVNAMTLATADALGKPSARIVLLKAVDETGFIFFTNYQSHKGSDLSQNPQAALVFFWKELERQVRIEGRVEKVTKEASDHYFYSRPVGSQLGACVSPQSSVIASRQMLEEKMKAMEESLKENAMIRPEHWGGYRVIPELIEFWQGRANRLHDRLQYRRELNAGWKLERLAP